MIGQSWSNKMGATTQYPKVQIRLASVAYYIWNWAVHTKTSLKEPAAQNGAPSPVLSVIIMRRASLHPPSSYSTTSNRAHSNQSVLHRSLYWQPPDCMISLNWTWSSFLSQTGGEKKWGLNFHFHQYHIIFCANGNTILIVLRHTNLKNQLPCSSLAPEQCNQAQIRNRIITCSH